MHIYWMIPVCHWQMAVDAQKKYSLVFLFRPQMDVAQSMQSHLNYPNPLLFKKKKKKKSASKRNNTEECGYIRGGLHKPKDNKDGYHGGKLRRNLATTLQLQHQICWFILKITRCFFLNSGYSFIKCC
jgi:hypothetical protein